MLYLQKNWDSISKGRREGSKNYGPNLGDDSDKGKLDYYFKIPVHAVERTEHLPMQ